MIIEATLALNENVVRMNTDHITHTVTTDKGLLVFFKGGEKCLVSPEDADRILEVFK